MAGTVNIGNKSWVCLKVKDREGGAHDAGVGWAHDAGVDARIASMRWAFLCLWRAPCDEMRVTGCEFIEKREIHVPVYSTLLSSLFSPASAFSPDFRVLILIS